MYVGVAEEARDLALATSGRSGNSRFRDDALTDVMVGQLETSLLTATAVHESALARLDGMGRAPRKRSRSRRRASRSSPRRRSPRWTLAVALSGGAAYFRRSPLERLARDVRAARFHPPAAPVSYQIVGARTRRKAAPEVAG
ncbi:MAG: hypothetical protein KatS3mg010_1149 [Acidimicrobiia bacterium]|nr:MAG: hypothetical protein KatS3mg010_1149 [Acidimicrobiia bacterium]